MITLENDAEVITRNGHIIKYDSNDLDSVSETLSEVIHPYLAREGCLPESSDEINDLSRDLIHATQVKHGQAWLWSVNPWSKEIADTARKVKDGENVLNFDGSFVTGSYDEKLHALMIDRLETPYTGTKDDMALINAIYSRLEEIKGKVLVWT